MHSEALYFCVLFAGAPVVAQNTNGSSAAYSGVATSSMISSSMTPAGAAPSVTSQSPTTTSNTTSFATTLDISVEGRKILPWDALLTQQRLMEYVRRTCGSLLCEHDRITNSGSNERTCSTASTLLFALSKWATKSNGCQERKLVISQGFLVGCGVCSLSSGRCCQRRRQRTQHLGRTDAQVRQCQLTRERC